MKGENGRISIKCSQLFACAPLVKANNHRCRSSYMLKPSNTIAINLSFPPAVPCSRKHGWTMVWLIDLVPSQVRKHANRCQEIWDSDFNWTRGIYGIYCKQNAKWQRISSQGLFQINCDLLATQGDNVGCRTIKITRGWNMYQTNEQGIQQSDSWIV